MSDKIYKHKVRVEYDGKYPNKCSGLLSIWLNDELVYSKNHCCFSTGVCYIDPEGNPCVETGDLIWEPGQETTSAWWYPFVEKIVNDYLDGIDVCCGGCL